MEKTEKYQIPTSFFFFILFSFLNISQSSYTPPAKPVSAPNSTKHFVLVHGAGHGAWCWFKIIPLLRSSGYNVTAIDLGASGTNPLQISDIHTFLDYLQPLTNLFASLPDNESVFLVGHSLGGLAISHAMETFPSKIKVAVFLTALMPGLSLNASVVYQMELQQLGDPQDSLVSIGDDPNFPISITFGPKFLRTRLYQLSPIEDWTLATTVTRTTPLPSQEDFSSGKLDVTREKFGTVKRVFIMTEKDLIVTREYQEFMVKANPPDEVKEIFGSDHMVTNSKPAELSTTLLQIAEKY